ncbi:proline dehydrogenase family protein [Paraburkholderia sp. SG-MS1]|uniref:proline dehydrogenase family protein n=1 Tax=Paraburkholderia sp. SG-MS1 TaxID=2023741 RepID=UPI001EE9E597|nr:proline dehydrogenase family protein [Paraburkholderia sp. SG-MS1]
MIDPLTNWLQREQIDRSRFEFEMLLGVCEPLRDALHAQGFNVRVSVPHGHDWYGYSTRRIKENPRIAGYILSAMIRSHRTRQQLQRERWIGTEQIVAADRVMYSTFRV